MNKVIGRFKKMMFSSFFISLLDVIVGILFIIFSESSTKVCVAVLGSLILVHGIFYLIRYIYDGLGTKFFAIDLIVGVASIILGLFTMFSPLSPLKYMGVYFCVWAFIIGVENFYYAYKFMKANEDIYPLLSIIALLIILMGLLDLFNPFSRFMLVTRLSGLFLICSGLFEIMVASLFRKRAKYLLNIVK